MCSQNGEAGVPILYKHGRKLVGDRTAKSRLLKVQVTGSQFTDDLALYAVICIAFESIGRKFVQVASYYGLTVSLPITKGLAMGTAVGEGDGGQRWRESYLFRFQVV